MDKKLGNKLATWVTLRLTLFGSYTYVQETLIRASYRGWQIEQMPIEFRRRPGHSRLIRSLGGGAYRAGVTIMGITGNTIPSSFSRSSAAC